MQMARSINPDIIDLSLMGDFDLGIDFDGFEENVKRIMEIPIKYLDSAHDKAVELFEDVHAMLWDPFPDGELPNEPHETCKDQSTSNACKDQSTSNVATGSLPSIETKLVGPNSEVSTPGPFVNAHETESISTKSPENTLSKGDHIKEKDTCLLPEDILTTELYDSATSEEIILWNPKNSAKQPRPPGPNTISEEDYVSHVLDSDKVMDELGLSGNSESSVYYGAIPLENSSATSGEEIVSRSANNSVGATTHETISQDLSTGVSRCTDDSTMHPDGTAKFVAIHLINGQQNMKSDTEGSYLSLRPNTSFKKMFMRNLSNKVGWSKKQTSMEQDVSARSHDEENLGYQIVSSSDDLDDDWEVV